MPPCHRTTARGILVLTLLATGIAAAPAGARPDAESAKVPQLIFPVVGDVKYRDDFGEPRGQGRHEGNDLMAPKRSVAVAVEAGKVKFWTTSSRAGCMLYLDGDSGTQYVYVHLNNDLTRANDNTGKCLAGTAYAPGLKNGDKVEAGQPIGYVGDSGDADGGSAHLHFEVHPNSGAAVSPYAYLRRAKKLLFAVTPGRPFTAALRGKLVEYRGSITLDVDQVTSWPGTIRVRVVDRRVELSVPSTTLVFDALGTLVAEDALAAQQPGSSMVAWTEKTGATLAAALGEPFMLTTEKIELGPTLNVVP
jgi:hypothetical protein